MQLIYNVNDKPKFTRGLLFALQQLLAILAATIAVPAIIGHGMSQSAALFGAGVGTFVYQFFTKRKSPVFLGSSFAFLGSMAAAFAGGVSASAGYLGLIIGAIFAGLVYVVIAVVIKYVGVNWINKIMPSVVIGPTVAIIGLSLAGNAVGDLKSGPNVYLALLCGLVTLFTVMIASVYGKKLMKMIPFIIGILAGYAVAAILTVIGLIADVNAMQIIDFSIFKNMQWIPDFTFVKAFFGEDLAFGEFKNFWGYLGSIAGCKIFVSNNIVKTTTDMGDVKYKCLMRTTRAIAFAEQLSEIEAYRPEKRFADAIKGLHLYGAKVVYPNEMVTLDICIPF